MLDNLPNIQQRSVEELLDRALLVHHRSIDDILFRFRNTVIVKALVLCEGNVTRTAAMLQTSRENLNRWMREAGLRGDDHPKVNS